MTHWASNIVNNQRGSVMNIALLILVLLALIAIYMSRASTTDIKIATNFKSAQKRFYETDSGADIATGLFEENIACPGGFTANNPPANDRLTINNSIVVETLTFWSNQPYPRQPSDPDAALPNPDRHAYLPDGYAAGEPHTNFSFGSSVEYGRGAALQMMAGYEGKGKGAAAGGAHYVVDIYSQHLDAGSEAMIWIRWMHLVGQEGGCHY